MTIQILDVVGVDSALLALQKSYSLKGKTLDWMIDQTKMMAKEWYKDSETKHLRFIQAYFDINAPRYWWQEFATYRHGVEMYSESTMHTLTRRKLTVDDFEVEDKDDKRLLQVIESLNKCIDDKKLMDAKRLLVESFLQSRIVMVSYQALKNMYHDRHDHKLSEWQEFCKHIKKLPYSEMIV